VTVGDRSGNATIRYGRRAIVHGLLACGKTPIPGVVLGVAISTVHGTPPAPPAPPPRTSGDGTFNYALPAGPSRSLTFTYTASAAEPTPTAQTSLKINVIPKITLRITPRRTTNDHTIDWRGRIEGGPYPPHGMPLLAQVKDGNRWQTFDELVVHHGKIAYSYTFLRTNTPTTYTFRVALPTGGAVGYPYTSAASRSIKVFVR